VCRPTPWATKDGEAVVAELPATTFALLERAYAPTAEEIRQNLIALRSRLGWSRKMLGAICGVSQSVIRRWESGERHPLRGGSTADLAAERPVLQPASLGERHGPGCMGSGGGDSTIQCFARSGELARRQPGGGLKSNGPK
jgi:DNA-binding transcriptional regulator YiaG